MGLHGCDSATAAPTGAGWYLSVYPTAGEAGGSFRYSLPGKRTYARRGGRDPERAKAEAARRARAKLRRYCAHNELNRLWTLTYANACHDVAQVRQDIGGFFRDLRASLGGKPLAYAWVPEWHKTGHGLHLHFALGRYVQHALVEQVWARGYVFVAPRPSDLPVGSGARGEARIVARYLSKYVSKSFGERGVEGLHRYEVAQGFQPEMVPVRGDTASDALAEASALMDGRAPSVVWDSAQVEDWQGPPAVWASWAG